MILHDLNNQWIVVLLLTLCSMMVVSQEALIATEKFEGELIFSNSEGQENEREIENDRE